MIITERQLRSLIREAIEDMDRRGFLKLFGSGLAAATASGIPDLASAEPGEIDDAKIDLKSLNQKEKQINLEYKYKPFTMTIDHEKLSDNLLTKIFKKNLSEDSFDIKILEYIEETVDKYFEGKNYPDQSIESFKFFFRMISTHVRQGVTLDDEGKINNLYKTGKFKNKDLFYFDISTSGLRNYEIKDLLKTFNKKYINIVRNGKSSVLRVDVI